jgi:glycyl-tRNA synthetase beta chain
MINRGLELLDEVAERPRETVASEVLTFFRVRLQNLWTSQGRSVEATEAILAAGFENIPDAFGRLNALEAFMEKEGFADLAISFKRVLNIVRGSPVGPVDAALFQLPQEKELFDILNEVDAQVTAHLQKGDPLHALGALAGIRGQIDRFFDEVLVNVEDVQLKENRLNMLACLGSLFLKLADFSKISTRP